MTEPYVTDAQGRGGRPPSKEFPPISFAGKRYYMGCVGYYTTLSLRYGKSTLLHRDRWECHNGPIPPGHIIHHKNGIKSDNRIENLELMSAAEHTRHHKGIDDELRKQIICLHSEGALSGEMARELGVDKTTVSRVLRAAGVVPNHCVGDKCHNTKIPDGEVKTILRLLRDNTQAAIAEMYGVSSSTIYNVINKRARGLNLTAPSPRETTKTHCPKGHPYSGENLITENNRKRCRTCNCARLREYRRRKKEERE